MNTVSRTRWDELCENQLQRALAGDAAAIRFCEKHRPGSGAGAVPETVTDLLTPTERERFEWHLSHNKLTPRQALFSCMAATFFRMFTREELRVWRAHLEVRQSTDAARPQEQADALESALALALERDQQREEARLDREKSA